MLRCPAYFVTAAYEKVRLLPQYLRALPINFLRNRLLSTLLLSANLYPYSLAVRVYAAFRAEGGYGLAYALAESYKYAV